MEVEIQLFGALREAEPGSRLRLDVQGSRVADLRDAVRAHASATWPASLRSLVERSAFASERSVLRDADALPVDGALALLPPVSGG
jgi:molybdopterin synthase sulfur carrier subunit